MVFLKHRVAELGFVIWLRRLLFVARVLAVGYALAVDTIEMV